MEKFFVNEDQINNNHIHIKLEDAKHISKVLRKKVNDELMITDNKQNTYFCKIIEFNENEVVCDICEYINENNETDINITLFQCIAKYDKMDYIIQKAVELGVKTICPVISQRVIVKLDEKAKNNKVERWNKIAYEASKQAKRTIIPTVENVINLLNICKLASKYDIILLAYESNKTKLKEILRKYNEIGIKEIGIIIGPEGGFDESEVQQLESIDNLKTISLGKRILRTETASVALISNILYELDEI